MSTRLIKFSGNDGSTDLYVPLTLPQAQAFTQTLGATGQSKTAASLRHADAFLTTAQAFRPPSPKQHGARAFG
ncbi:MAG: hypothetical protein WKF84_01140 [Pyrinomonadaceae bacterium]